MKAFQPRLDILPPSQRALWPKLVAVRERFILYQRAEAKDYLDIYALLKSGLSLTDGLRFSKEIYGADFNTLLPLQALCYFQEPSLRELPEEVKETLVESVRSASPRHAG